MYIPPTAAAARTVRIAIFGRTGRFAQELPVLSPAPNTGASKGGISRQRLRHGEFGGVHRRRSGRLPVVLLGSLLSLSAPLFRFLPGPRLVLIDLENLGTSLTYRGAFSPVLCLAAGWSGFRAFLSIRRQRQFQGRCAARDCSIGFASTFAVGFVSALGPALISTFGCKSAPAFLAGASDPSDSAVNRIKQSSPS